MTSVISHSMVVRAECKSLKFVEARGKFVDTPLASSY
jgi:hypothetical protein